MKIQKVVAEAAEFNRVCARFLGVFARNFPMSEFTQTEARILFELEHCAPCTAQYLCDLLGIDKSYMSRILRGFEAHGILERTLSPKDNRAYNLELTDVGLETIAALKAVDAEIIAERLEGLDKTERARLYEAMSTIRELLER